MNSLHNVPVVVTGGCGFIGSHVAKALVRAGARVTIIDDLSTGFLNNIESIKNDITCIHGSIIDPDLCKQITKNTEIIFHLAAFVSVPDSLANPVGCYTTNVQGTMNMLEAARSSGSCKKFIFASSASVYGNHEGTCTEEQPVDPQSPYAYSKYIGELLCLQYNRLSTFRSVILRYFNVYGPGQSTKGAYPAVAARFQECLSLNKPITIFGNGQQTRDFIHVNAVVNATLSAALWQERGPINVATGASMSLHTLLHELRQNYPHYSASITYEAGRPGDLMHSHADCSKLSQLPIIDFSN